MEAAQSQRLVLVHFTTRSCGPCRMLDQNVFSQPQVAAAIEQNYVPVRIDADASPALATAYRIDRVPTELVLTPDGTLLTKPPIPDKPDSYVAQIQGLARHFRQSAASAAEGSTAHMNAAYAGLPMAPPPPSAAAANPNQQSQQNNSLQANAAVGAGPAMIAPASPAQTAATPQPQTQGNPYLDAPPQSRYGEAQSVYASPQGSRYTPAEASAPPPQQAQSSASAGASSVAASGSPSQQMANTQMAPAQTAAKPAGASPQTVRNPFSPSVAAAAPAAAAAATTYPSTGSVAATGDDLAEAAAVSTGALAATSAPKPPKPQLPAGAPPLAFDGCCPVTLKTVKKWALGDQQYGAVHRGRTYLFAGAEQRDQFMADPDAFAPVFAGMDPVLLIDKQQSVEGSRAFGFEYGGSFYLFSSRESMQKFAASPHTYAAGVRQAMNRIDAASGGTIRR